MPECRATYTCRVTTGTVIRRVEPRDGPLVKSLRLRALAADPTSFASTHGREAAYIDEKWDAWAAGDATGDEMATMIALRGVEPVGIVAAYRDDVDVRVYHVIAMWVAPESRGRGLGRRLLQAIEDWIVESRGTSVQLEVADAAEAAFRLYESAGYMPDGSQSPSPHTSGVTHIGLRKRLA
jgi:ribosomal protein S18 acetylase RimI-like enzyme